MKPTGAPVPYPISVEVTPDGMVKIAQFEGSSGIAHLILISQWQLNQIVNAVADQHDWLYERVDKNDA